MQRSRWLVGGCAAVLAAAWGWFAASQATVVKPTLPPPTCDHSGAVQYFPPGPELLLSNEAAALEDYLKMQQAAQP